MQTACVCVCVKITLNIMFITKDLLNGANCLWRNFQISHHRKRTLVLFCVWGSKFVHTRIWANSNNMQSMPDENHLPPFHTAGLAEWCCVYILERQKVNALVIWPSTNVNRLHTIYAFDIINVSTYVAEVRTGRTGILGGLKWETKDNQK